MHRITATTVSGRQEWKNGWTVVLAAAAGTSLGSLTTYATGLFINPLEQEYGWSRAGISGAVTIFAAVGVVGSTFAGYFLDRIGARRMALYSSLIFCAVLACLSLTTASIWSWWGIWFAIGVAALGLKPAVWSKAVTSFFVKSRGMAIAAMLCGTGVSSSLMPLLTNSLITNFGWRGAFLGLALVFAIVVIPLLWLFLYDATDKAPQTERKQQTALLPGWSAAYGLRRRETWQLALAALIVTAVLVGYVVHIVPMLTLLGLERSKAVQIVSIVGILAVISRLVVGYIFDRISHPAVGALSLAAPILPAIIMLVFTPSLTTALCAVAALGICVGGEYDAVIYLASRYFGLRAFGTLFGVVESALLAGVGLGPFIAGYVFDITQSYQWFLIGVIPACLISGLLVMTLGIYPVHNPPVAGV